MKSELGIETTRIRFGFKSKRQLPLFMVWKEYYTNGKITGGSVLFSTLNFLKYRGKK